MEVLLHHNAIPTNSGDGSQINSSFILSPQFDDPPSIKQRQILHNKMVCFIFFFTPSDNQTIEK